MHLILENNMKLVIQIIHPHSSLDFPDTQLPAIQSECSQIKIFISIPLNYAGDKTSARGAENSK